MLVSLKSGLSCVKWMAVVTVESDSMCEPSVVEVQVEILHHLTRATSSSHVYREVRHYLTGRHFT